MFLLLLVNIIFKYLKKKIFFKNIESMKILFFNIKSFVKKIFFIGSYLVLFGEVFCFLNECFVYYFDGV